MDTNISEKINGLLNKWQKLSEELEALKAEIEALKASRTVATEPSAAFDSAVDEVIDIDIDLEPAPASSVPEEIPEDIPEVSPEEIQIPEEVPAPEDIQEKTTEEIPEKVAEKLPEESPKEEKGPESKENLEDMPENLFGDDASFSDENYPPMRRRRAPKAIYQTSPSAKAVVDAMSAKAAWRTDMPGPEVRSLRSAIALGDQVVFINRLFRKDSALYQATIDTLNNTDSLASAVHYLSDTFPEWDLESEDVYRFMMAVRRKIRK